jgi:hypothetical protein
MPAREEYKRLKRRLTYRINRLNGTAARLKLDPYSLVKRELVVFDAGQIIKEVEYAERIFDDVGFPDLWNRWIRAKEDAMRLIQLHTH